MCAVAPCFGSSRWCVFVKMSSFECNSYSVCVCVGGGGVLVGVLKVCCGSFSCCLLCVKPKAAVVKLFWHALLGQVLVLPAGFGFASRHRAVIVTHCGGDFKVVFA